MFRAPGDDQQSWLQNMTLEFEIYVDNNDDKIVAKHNLIDIITNVYVYPKIFTVI